MEWNACMKIDVKQNYNTLKSLSKSVETFALKPEFV